MSWYAYAAMFRSSNKINHMIQLCYHTIAYPRIGLLFCQHMRVSIVQYSVCGGGGGGETYFFLQTNANQRQCTPQKGRSASLFSMPNRVKPQDTPCVWNRKQTIMSDYS